MRALSFFCLLLMGCSNTQSPESLSKINASGMLPAQSTQLIVVVSDHWDATQGQLYSFEKVQQQWVAQPISGPVTLGRKGLAWGMGLHPIQKGLQKIEGDGRAPAGLFKLSGAFGYLPTLDTAMPYQAMQSDDYCIDVATSPLYNLTVNRSQYQPVLTQGSTEPMRRDLHEKGDQAYFQGLFIDHNPMRLPGAGSCIFMHLWQSPTKATAGCTAMAKPQLSALLRWLHPDKQPVYLLLPISEYQSLKSSWQLPDLPVTK